jgi:phosphate transport system substrate-binding protein
VSFLQSLFGRKTSLFGVILVAAVAFSAGTIVAVRFHFWPPDHAELQLPENKAQSSEPPPEAVGDGPPAAGQAPPRNENQETTNVAKKRPETVAATTTMVESPAGSPAQPQQNLAELNSNEPAPDEDKPIADPAGQPEAVGREETQEGARPAPEDQPESNPRQQAAEHVILHGAGATFPNAIYSKWFSAYRKVEPNVEISYQSIGSGGGIKQLQSQTVDFGASDGPMTDEQIRQTPSGVIHVPTVLNAVVPIYNIPGVNSELKFTPDVLADIFLGNIRNWADPRLAKANPGVPFPDKDIIVVHRSDGSGVNYIFSDYLSKVSPAWKDRMGKSTSLNWQVGLGGKGCEGVAGTVKQTEGSIGYVELIYALQNKMGFGAVQNASGQFVKASLDSVTAAGSFQEMPGDFRISITNAPGKSAYPISSFTWILVPAQAKDPAHGRQLLGFLEWMLGPGQAMAGEMSYAPLPKQVVQQLRRRLGRAHLVAAR